MKTDGAPIRSRRGYALLVSVSLLALLALLGTLYVNVARVESQVAGTFVLQARAKMLAMSGVEAAVARVRAVLRRRPWTDPRPAASGGEDWLFRNDDAGPWRMMTPAPPVPVDVGNGIPLARARNPSLPSPIPPPAPAGALASGYLPGTFQRDGDYFLVKVLDCAGQLNLNLYAGPSAPEYAMDGVHETVLRSVLTRLGQALASDVPGPPGYPNLNPLEPADIASLLAARRNRPAGAPQLFAAKAELEALYARNYAGGPPAGIVADPALGAAKWEKLRDFVTVAGMARGEGRVAGTATGYEGAELGRPVFGRDRGVNPPENSWQDDRREPLIPVNVNTAPYPVLFALLAGGIRGRAMVVEEPPSARPGIGNVAILRKPEVLPAIADVEAAAIARSLVLARQEPFSDANANGRHDAGEPFTDLNGNGRYEGPFTCFGDLMEWAATPGVNALVAGDDETRRRKWALLFANFNPNTLYNKSNPDWPAPRGAETWIDWSLVDRTDLDGWTTCLTFGSTGYCEVESIGRVTARVGGTQTVMAEKALRAVVRVTRLLHHTSQRDFEVNVTAANSLTHPESMRDFAGSFHPGAAADVPVLEYDGRVQISSENAPPAGGARMHLRFGGDYAGTPGGAPLDPAPAPRREEFGGAASRTVLMGSELLPDGTLSRSAVPGDPTPEALQYGTVGHVDLMQSGSFEFFIKLMKRGDQGTDEAWVFVVQDDPIHDADRPEPHDLWLCHKVEYFGGAVARLTSVRFYFERTPLTLNSPLSPWLMAFSERSHDVSGWRAHEWHHVAVSWTNAGLDGGGSHVFRVDGDGNAVEFDLPRQTFVEGGGVNGGDRTTRNLFTLRSNQAVERIWLGGYSILGNNEDIYYSFNNGGVNMGAAQLHRFVSATMDEFIARPGPAPAVPPARFQTTAAPGPGASRHRGRMALPPDTPAGSELGTIAWTAYLPRAWGATPIPSPAIRPGIAFQGYRDGAAATAAIGVSHPQAGGGGVPFLAGVRNAGPGTVVEYEFHFLNSGTAPLQVTPILDDVTLYLLVPPRAVEWTWLEE